MIIGSMGEIPLAAHVVVVNVTTFASTPSAGLFSSACVLVGNAIGANLPRLAKWTSGVCICCNMVIWFFVASCLLYFRRMIAHTYSPQEEVQDLVQKLLVLYSVAGFFHTTNGVILSVMRGLGEVKKAAMVYLFTFYGVMLPLAIFFGIQLDLGIIGVWCSFIIGTGLAMIIMVKMLYDLDYEVTTAEAAKRIEAHSELAGGDKALNKIKGG